MPLAGPASSDFRTTAINALAVFVGQPRATELFDQGVAQIERSAGEGAAKKVKPYVIGSLVVGGLGLLLGVIAITRK